MELNSTGQTDLGSNGVCTSAGDDHRDADGRTDRFVGHPSRPLGVALIALG